MVNVVIPERADVDVDFDVARNDNEREVGRGVGGRKTCVLAEPKEHYICYFYVINLTENCICFS